jgi:hypothetical protein
VSGMLELSDQKFKMTMINMVKVLIKKQKGDTMQEQKNSVSN